MVCLVWSPDELIIIFGRFSAPNCSRTGQAGLPTPTTGNWVFAECKIVCRVHYIGHSAEKLFVERFKKIPGKIIALNKRGKKNVR